MRRLVILGSTLVLFDVTFYSAIAPLLPEYVDSLGLTKAEAGVLSAAYAAGTLVAALPGGLLASRVGPRRTVIGGLALLGASSLVFGFGQEVGLLDLARFSQGVAGALIWSGALTWVISAAPPERRGALIGTVLGTAIAGALIGPALGALAVAIGTKIVFGAVVGISIGFALIALRTPVPPEPEQQAIGEVIAAIKSPLILTATAFVAVPSLMFGATEVLVPLRIDDLGGSEALIAGAFIAAAGLEAGLSPVIGSYSDRVGRRIPFVTGLVIAAAAILGIGAGQSNPVVIGALLVSSLGAGICFTPAITLLSEVSEASSLHQGLAAGLSNMAWASGQVVGGLAGGALAGAAGYQAPTIVVAIILFATAAYAVRRDLPAPAAPTAAG